MLLRTSRRHALRTRHLRRALTAKAGVPASLVSDIEKGKVEPSISTLKRMSNAMDVNITYFFTEQSQMKRRVIRAQNRVVLAGTNDSRAETSADDSAEVSNYRSLSPEDVSGIT